MQKYWTENKQVQTWGLRIIKTIILGSFGILVCAFAIETVPDFISLIRNPAVLEPYCTSDCNFSVTVGLFCLLSLYQVGLLLGLIKCPKGFGLNFLLVFWGFIGLMYLEDAWQYSWQQKTYTWTFAEGISYKDYIGRNLIFWMWSAIGVLQVYLRPPIRKYVISTHCAILGIMFLIGAIMNLFE